MQRVIDRKLNDTDRAERIARHAPNTDRGDFYYLIESLYKTSEGEYFLHCKGGAATEDAEPCDGGPTAGKEINLLDMEAALDWCEERAIDGETVVEEFSHLIET